MTHYNKKQNLTQMEIVSKENFDAMHETIADMDEKDQNEMREYFNHITSEQDLGDVLFNAENTFEEVQSKINALDEESQKQFIEAVNEMQYRFEVSEDN